MRELTPLALLVSPSGRIVDTVLPERENLTILASSCSQNLRVSPPELKDLLSILKDPGF